MMHSKPNILVIMVDQITPFLAGNYVNSEVRTQNLDKLAASGSRCINDRSPCLQDRLLRSIFVLERGCNIKLPTIIP